MNNLEVSFFELMALKVILRLRFSYDNLVEFIVYEWSLKASRQQMLTC